MSRPAVEALVRACKARDYNEEGIPMFLMLEDATAEGGGPPPADEDRELTALAAAYLRELAADPDNPTLSEVATALEVLASQHFEPQDAS